MARNPRNPSKWPKYARLPGLNANLPHCTCFTRLHVWFGVSWKGQCHAEGGATKGGVSRCEQTQTNADKHWQAQTDAEAKTQANASKRKQTRANADKRKQTLTPPFIVVSYTPRCNPLKRGGWKWQFYSYGRGDFSESGQALHSKVLDDLVWSNIGNSPAWHRVLPGTPKESEKSPKGCPGASGPGEPQSPQRVRPGVRKESKNAAWGRMAEKWETSLSTLIF